MPPQNPTPPIDPTTDGTTPAVPVDPVVSPDVTAPADAAGTPIEVSSPEPASADPVPTDETPTFDAPAPEATVPTEPSEPAAPAFPAEEPATISPEPTVAASPEPAMPDPMQPGVVADAASSQSPVQQEAPAPVTAPVPEAGHKSKKGPLIATAVGVVVIILLAIVALVFGKK